MTPYIPPPRVFVRPGDTVRTELPCSEVCMHLRVAEKVMSVRVEPGGINGPYAQILDDAGRNFSFGILMSEAGFYRDPARGSYCGWYFYPALCLAGAA